MKIFFIILIEAIVVWGFFKYQNIKTLRMFWQCPECYRYGHTHEEWCSIGRCWAPDWWITKGTK
jgi:hypothetical protein